MITQQELEQRVAAATGESLATIRWRGFGLHRPKILLVVTRGDDRPCRADSSTLASWASRPEARCREYLD